MLNQRSNGFQKSGRLVVREPNPELGLHPAWLEFVRYCAELRHGEIELLKIQDGLPVLAGGNDEEDQVYALTHRVKQKPSAD